MRHLRRVTVGDVEDGAVAVRLAFFIMKPVEGKQHRLETRPHAIDQIEHARDIALVELAGGFIHAASVHVKQFLQAQQRVPQTVHGRAEPRPVVRVARAHQMNMAIPYLRRVQPCPYRLQQRMMHNSFRQIGETWVCPSLFRPVFPAAVCTADEAKRGHCAQKLAAVHSALSAILFSVT